MDDNDELKFDGIKLGWARINIHYSFDQYDLDYIIKAIDFIIEKGYKFLKYYYFSPVKGTWTHINGSFKKTSLSVNLLT